MGTGYLLTFVALLAAPAPPARSEFQAAAAPIRAKLEELEKLRETAPARYVEESLKAADDLAAAADRFKSDPQSGGARDDVVTLRMKLADFARVKLHDPRRAIALYQRVAPAPAMNEEIADIYEYDLNDNAAAAAALKALRPFAQSGSLWQARWLDAELQYLEHGKEFGGDVTAADLAAFNSLFILLTGREITNGELLGDLNPYEVPEVLPPPVREKLLNLPPSHSTFLKTWLFATRLASADDARRWLTRNDKAGFWRSCLLAMYATREDAGPGFAIVAREYAKRHPIPKLASP